MSTRTLSRRFLEQVGATPTQWIARARVRRAQRLLETSALARTTDFEDADPSTTFGILERLQALSDKR